MNILLLESDLNRWGGSEGMAFAVSGGLADKGHQIFLAFQTNGKLLAKHASIFKDVFEVRLQPFGWRSLVSSLGTTAALGRLAKRNQIDVIFTSHRGFLRTLALIKIFWKIPFAYHLGLQAPGRTLLTGWAIRRMGAGVAPSQGTGDSWVKTGLPSERLHIVSNWIDFSRFAPVANKWHLRNQVDLPSAGPAIVFVGRVLPEKGVEILLYAFAQVSKQFPEAVLLLVGEASESYSRTIQGMCVDLDLSDRQLKQVGHSANPEVYLAAADIVVVPSTAAESFGLTAIEAMACGALTLVSSAGALQTIMGIENQDLVFPPGDANTLASLLRLWIESPEKAIERGRALRNYVLKEFQGSDKILRYEDILSAVVQTKPSSFHWCYSIAFKLRQAMPMLKRLVPPPLKRWILMRNPVVSDICRQLIGLPSRQFLATKVLPWLCEHSRAVLFVGVAPYTYSYYNIFKSRRVRLVTTDILAGNRTWGGREHIVSPIQEIDRWMRRETFDAVILNGVFGYGVDSASEMNRTLEAVAIVMRPGGVLVVGWNAGRICDPTTLEGLSRLFKVDASLPFLPRQKFANESHIYDFYVRLE